jgi:hypothetical protein
VPGCPSLGDVGQHAPLRPPPASGLPRQGGRGSERCCVPARQGQAHDGKAASPARPSAACGERLGARRRAAERGVGDGLTFAAPASGCAPCVSAQAEHEPSHGRRARHGERAAKAQGEVERCSSALLKGRMWAHATSSTSRHVLREGQRAAPYRPSARTAPAASLLRDHGAAGRERSFDRSGRAAAERRSSASAPCPRRAGRRGQACGEAEGHGWPPLSLSLSLLLLSLQGRVPEPITARPFAPLRWSGG